MGKFLVLGLPFFKLLVVFLEVVVFGVCDTLSSDFEPGGKPEIKVINPDAEAFIGAVINIRERGSGLFGCGERRLDGIITADALKWMVDSLNSKIWSEFSSNVSLGLSIIDSCGRTRTAASQLIEFLPTLQSNENSSNLPMKFSIIDDIGLEKEADISKTLESINVAIVDTNININSPHVVINAVLLFVRELRWEHLTIVYSTSRFSSSMLKQLTKLLKKSELCVPWVVNIDDEPESDLQAAFKSGIPILSLLPSEEHPLFLKSLERFKPRTKIPILFSDSVTRGQLQMVSPNKVQVFSVVAYPEKEAGFESFYAKNSIMNGVRTEDELDVIHRTKIVRKMKRISEKISEALRKTMLEVCKEKEGLCQEVVVAQGKSLIADLIKNTDWTDGEQLYELVEYQYQFPEEHVHLHKIMAYNGHKNLEIFEANISFTDLNCDEENVSRPECRCLEVQWVRSNSGRNIDDWGKKKQKQSKHLAEKEKTQIPTPNIQPLEAVQTNPMIFSFLSNPLEVTLACLTLLGSLLTLVIAQYFATFAALPNGGLTSGTSVIGYVILIGLFLLFSTNLIFLLTPLMSTCALRRVCTSFSYAMIFSGMLIKVWSSLRQITSEKLKIWKPINLLFYSVAFSSFQLFPSGLWLILKPPAIEYSFDRWKCYPSGDLDAHLVLSMIYPLLLLLITLILAVRTCSKGNNDEARWILISSSLAAIIFSCWGVAIATGVWQLHRTACTNLSVGTIILVCIYIPKIKIHSQLKKSLKMQKNLPPAQVDLVKERSVFTTATPQIPVVLGYNMVTPVMQENVIDSSHINKAYSLDGTSETGSTPFDIDSSSFSEIEQEPYTFSTFLEDPQVPELELNNSFDDPTQVVPSALYPLEMFNNEPVAITSDHCQPGTNEFTPPHRTASQLYLCPQPEWVP